MKITVVQPPYYAGEKPDETIARFLLEQMKQAAAGLIVLPEYSNAGGLSEPEAILAAVHLGKWLGRFARFIVFLGSEGIE